MAVGEKLDEKLIEASEGKERPWSLPRVAEATEIDLSYLYRVRHGKHLPSDEKLQKIADVVGIDVDDLVFEREVDEIERDTGLPRPIAELGVLALHADPDQREAILEKVQEALEVAGNVEHGNGQ